MVKQKWKPKTGIFLHREDADFVVLWQGREICRYATVEEFIDAHIAGLQALDTSQADLLESYYKTLK